MQRAARTILEHRRALEATPCAVHQDIINLIPGIVHAEDPVDRGAGRPSELLKLWACCMLVCGASYDGPAYGAPSKEGWPRFSSYSQPCGSRWRMELPLPEAGCDSLLAVGAAAPWTYKCIKPAPRPGPPDRPPHHRGRAASPPGCRGVPTGSSSPWRTPYPADYAVLAPGAEDPAPVPQTVLPADALRQGVESWWSLNSTGESRGLSKRAVSRSETIWTGTWRGRGVRWAYPEAPIWRTGHQYPNHGGPRHEL